MRSNSHRRWPGLRAACARRRAGLTLMELVIVMAILAALAAILVPLFPNLLRRAHKATDATQTSEVTKAIQLYQGSYTSYPDGFDQLTDGTTFPAYLPTDGGPFGGFVNLSPLTADEVSALGRVGVNNVTPLAPLAALPLPSGFQPTLYPYATNPIVSVPINATDQFAVIDPAGTSGPIVAASPLHMITTIWQKDPTARFVVFGVGPRTTMVGTTIQDAPTSVPQKKTFTPANTYSRVGVVFLISGVEVGRTERARYVGAVALEDDELESTEKDVIGYHEASLDPGT